MNLLHFMGWDSSSDRPSRKEIDRQLKEARADLAVSVIRTEKAATNAHRRLAEGVLAAVGNQRGS